MSNIYKTYNARGVCVRLSYKCVYTGKQHSFYGRCTFTFSHTIAHYFSFTHSAHIWTCAAYGWKNTLYGIRLGEKWEVFNFFFGISRKKFLSANFWEFSILSFMFCPNGEWNLRILSPLKNTLCVCVCSCLSVDLCVK